MTVQEEGARGQRLLDASGSRLRRRRRPRSGPGDSAAKQAIAKTNRWVIALPPTTDTALVRQHGTATIWSHDRELRKVNGITVRDRYGDCRFAGRAWRPPRSGPAVGCGARRLSPGRHNRRSHAAPTGYRRVAS